VDGPTAGGDRPDGRRPPSLPWVLTIVSIAVAVLATSGFVYLLLKRTVGPGTILRDFYQAVHNGDCDASYDLLAHTVAERVEPGDWCSAIQQAGYPATFSIEQTLLVDDVAVLTVEEAGDGATLDWGLERAGRSWVVRDFPAQRDVLRAAQTFRPSVLAMFARRISDVPS